MKKPNLLLYVSDHFRSEALHHLGNEASNTPNFDNFIKEGVSFSNAFCQDPVCVPSRCSFLSGNYPHVGGFRTMHHLQSAHDQNFLKELKNNGYHIYFGGKNDVFSKEVPLIDYCDYRCDAYLEVQCLANGTSLPEGYHSILKNYTQEDILNSRAFVAKSSILSDPDSKYYYSFFKGAIDTNNAMALGNQGAEDAQIYDAINYIKNYHDDKPLCIYLSLLMPHPFYVCSKKDYQFIPVDKISPCIRLNENELALKPSIFKGIRENQRLNLWTDEELLDFKRTYLAMVHHVDENFGKVLKALKDKGIYDNTAIFSFSDHGDYASDYEIAEINQNTFEDVLTKVPLLIKPQSTVIVLPGIRKCLVELIDIPDTIAELAGIKLSYPTFGKSLLPVLEKDTEHRDYVHCEGGRREDETHCMDGGHNKLFWYWARTSEQMKMPQHTKAVMIRNHHYKYVKRLYEKDEFYDLKSDPQERLNVIEQPEYKVIIDQFKVALSNFMLETCDQVPYQRDER